MLFLFEFASNLHVKYVSLTRTMSKKLLTFGRVEKHLMDFKRKRSQIKQTMKLTIFSATSTVAYIGSASDSSKLDRDEIDTRKLLLLC